MKFIYNSFVSLISRSLPALGLFNTKVKSFIDGRKNQVYPTHLLSPVWIHCASLGEFEQGRPVIEAIKKEWPSKSIVLTFFSKSGYEIRKNYPYADWIGYMPMDTTNEATHFIQTIQPCIAIFVKYEFWYNHMDILIQKKIPYLFISVNFFKGHYLLNRGYRWLLNKTLEANAIFVQDEASKMILFKKGYQKAIFAGDTRIDRVMDIAMQTDTLKYFDKNDSTPILVAGSTWPTDESILKEFFNAMPQYKMILAPHDPTTSRIESLIIFFEKEKPVIHSQWRGEPYRVMIIDSIGLLNKLYAYAQVSYVGGGFGKGIHNILEPAAYGIPVFFGPRYHAFLEAEELVSIGTAFSIQNAKELEFAWKKSIPILLSDIKNRTAQYFTDRKGATAQIIDYLRDFI